MKATVWMICAAATTFLLGGCAAPFSELQSARLVGTGNVEITGSVSAVSATSRGETGRVNDLVGVQLATGISERTDLRLRYDRIIAPDVDLSGPAINIVSAGPKISIVEDHFAFYLPVGTAFGDGVQSSKLWQTHPTILLTAVPSRYVDVTGSFKVLISLGDYRIRKHAVAFNLGMGFSTNLERWALRPEVGVMSYNGGDGYFHHTSLALAVATGSTD